jgi:hypothetical protein
MKHTFVLLTVLAGIAFSSVQSQDSAPERRRKVASARTEATYLVTQIRNITVDAEYGDVFFDAAEDHYVWHLEEGTKAEKLHAAFLIADRLKSSSKIEVSRWEPREGQRPTGRYRGEVLHQLLNGLVLQAP